MTLKLKSKVSPLGSVVLWVICSPFGWAIKKITKISRWLLEGSGRSWCSFADMSLHHPFTLLASDIAAPVIFAVAAFYQFLCVRVVSTIAAHHVAAVTARGRFVALSGNWKRKKKKIISKVSVISFNPPKCFSICKILPFSLSYKENLRIFKTGIQRLCLVK